MPFQEKSTNANRKNGQNSAHRVCLKTSLNRIKIRKWIGSLTNSVKNSETLTISSLLKSQSQTHLTPTRVGARSSSPAPPGRSENWRDALKTFGIDIHVCSDKSEKPSPPPHAQRAIVYRLGDTEFLTDIEIYQWEDLPVSYDFRIFRPVVPYRDDTDAEKFADYDYLADASEGVKWLGALRMDVDNLGTVFTRKT